MKVLKVINFFMLLGLFCACNQTDKKIFKYVQSICSNDVDTCRIDLRQALNVDYDKMYLFGESTTDDEISSIIGQEYHKNKTITDSKYRIILLKNQKIVYENDFYQHDIYFAEITEERDTINLPTFFYLIHNTPYYFVTKKYHTNNTECYYVLTLISKKENGL